MGKDKSPDSYLKRKRKHYYLQDYNRQIKQQFNANERKHNFPHNKHFIDSRRRFND